MTELERRIEGLGPWFHNLHLPDGTETCPTHSLGDFPNEKWRRLAHFLPADLSGADVLDVGCNAGFYSFELAKRGAQVTGLDSSEHYLRQARWAAELMGLSDRVRFERRQIYELGATTRRWDIVLFMGVIYHLRYPLLGLDIVSRCVGKLLVVQSLLSPDDSNGEVPPNLELQDRVPLVRPGWPKLSFVERRLAGDPSNWWVPNRACLEAMVRSSGMRILAAPIEEFLLCEPDRDGETSMWRWNQDEYWAAVGPRKDS